MDSTKVEENLPSFYDDYFPTINVTVWRQPNQVTI